MTGVDRNRIVAVGLGALNLAIIVYLAGGMAHAAVFVAFAVFLFVPAASLLWHVSSLRHDAAAGSLRLLHAFVAAIVLAVPYLLLRKAVGFGAVFDFAAALVLTFFAARGGVMRSFIAAVGESLRGAVLSMTAIAVCFATVWTGFSVQAGAETRFYGLFAIDFGVLAADVISLRMSPFLPLSFVSGGGRIVYHWLYFAFPATLADFGGADLPAINALLLTNLIVAGLLFFAVTSFVRAFVATPRAVLAAAITLFAPFTYYYYQAVAGRFDLRWLALPARNYLLLSPLNSMMTFGNNCCAIILAIVAAIGLRRWNEQGRRSDAIAAMVAAVAIIGYSITLVFPVALWLVVLFVIGDIRNRPVIAAIAAAAGVFGIVLLYALGVIGGASGGRHVAVAFDHFGFLRMLAFGMLPLWLAFVLGFERRLRSPAVLAGCCVAVPTFLHLAGSPTGHIDFSMKIGTLLAIACAPFVAVALERRGFARAVVLTAIVLGLVQSAAYVVRYPWYRLRGSGSRFRAIPADYGRALLWIRERTPRSASVIDPEGLRYRDALFTTMIGERAVWLPTPYTDAFLITSGGEDLDARRKLWDDFAAHPADARSSEALAERADYLILPRRPDPAGWRLETCTGAWCVWRSTLHGPERP